MLSEFSGDKFQEVIAPVRRASGQKQWFATSNSCLVERIANPCCWGMGRGQERVDTEEKGKSQKNVAPEHLSDSSLTWSLAEPNARDPCGLALCCLVQVGS